MLGAPADGRRAALRPRAPLVPVADRALRARRLPARRGRPRGARDRPALGFVHALAIVALIVILFRDGLEVEAEMLQREWRLPLRKLVLAMPITAVIVAVADTRWPTSAGRSASCSAPCCRRPTRCSPRRASSPTRACRGVRHSLNLESGLNDGLALPAVLAFAAAARSARRTSSGGSSCSRTSRSASRSGSASAWPRRRC